MKNLLIYINPDGFDEESQKLAKIQIDNSLELDWKKEDIIFITNFSYKHNGITATVVEKGYCTFKKEASKITTLAHLFDIGLIKDDLYWCHDLDAYQLEPINEEELGLTELDAGFCDYGRIQRWQMGSFFFKKKAEDIFRAIVEGMTPKYVHGRQLNDEDVMVDMTNNNINGINGRIKRLNGRYDFGMRRVDYCYDKAVKPLKVLHFHPHNPIINTLAIAMYGKNRINKPLMNERLIRIFNKYGYL